MKLMLQIGILSLLLMFNTGCSVKSMFGDDEDDLTQHKELKNIEISKKNEYTELEKEIVEVAKEHKRFYNEYIEILTSLKHRTKMYDSTKIPKRLARRTTFHYEGPALLLLKNIAEETQYNFNYDKYRTYDSKNIVRHYTDTMLIDIIYDITSEFGFDILIDEKDASITLQER